jgi:hypothetical protein
MVMKNGIDIDEVSIDEKWFLTDEVMIKTKQEQGFNDLLFAGLIFFDEQ